MKVILKILNSGLILKIFTHAYIWQSFHFAPIGHLGKIRQNEKSQ